MNILIVDDNPTHLEPMRAQLESEGHEITQAQNSTEAGERMDHERMDAVISSSLMPRLDGTRLGQEIRKHDRLCKLPTIIYSSIFTSLDDLNMVLETGASNGPGEPVPVKIIVAPPDDAAAKRHSVPNPGFLPDVGLAIEYSQWLMDMLSDEKAVHEEAKATLSATRDQLAHLIKHRPAALYSLKVEGERVMPQPASETMSRMLGFTEEECRALDWWEKQVHPEDRDRVMAGIIEVITAGIWNSEYRIRHKGGHYLWIEDHQHLVRNVLSKPVSIVGVRMDISQRKQDENYLRREQRLASIGTLACNVAHDLNNLFAPILLSAETLRMDFPDLPKDSLELIETSAKRGASMVKQLLTFVKGTNGKPVVVQTHSLLKEVERWVKISLPKEIKLQTDLAEGLLPIRGDATQLEQALLNLCLNARDAMPDGGTMTLKAENVEISTMPASIVGEFKPGAFVALSVIDAGTGIPPEILDRIFEPFFTTKGPEKGTGLGLSNLAGTAKSHGGFVQVISTLGKGSRFTLYLPAANPVTDAVRHCQ